MSKVHKVVLTFGDEENGEEVIEKTYFVSKVKGRIYRRSLELMQLLKRVQETNQFEPHELDEMMDFVVYAFGNKFTIDDLYDGVDLEDLIPLFIDTVQYASNPSGKQIEGK